MVEKNHESQRENSAKDKIITSVRKSKLTVNRFREPQNKSILKHATNIVKNDILGLFREIGNILHQTENVETYATCKGNPTCSDAIDELDVQIPPAYKDILTDDSKNPIPGAATVEALSSTAKATGRILNDVGSMEAYSHRHASYPGDPTVYDPNRKKSQLFRDREAVIRDQVEIVETPETDEKDEK